MSTLPTRSELFAVGRRAIVTTPNVKINPIMIDVPGSDVNLNVGAMSVIGEEIVSRAAACMRGLFLETARDDQLDRKAFDNFGLTRLSASPAKVPVRFWRPAGGVAGVYPAGSVVQTTTGVQFATDTDVQFLVADLEKAVNATALETGPNGNVGAETIKQMVDTPFDPTISVVNDAQASVLLGDTAGTGAAAGGMDTEDDVAFRARCRSFFPTVRRGILGAIEYGATQVPGVAVATAIEYTNPDTGFPVAYIQLVIADRDGNATPSLEQDVANMLLEYRAAGIPVKVVSGVVTYQTVSWALAFQQGINEAEAREQIRAITVAVSQFLPPGPERGILYRSTLLAAARTVNGVVLRADALRDPLDDVVPTSNTQILRVRPQDVSFIAAI